MIRLYPSITVDMHIPLHLLLHQTPGKDGSRISCRRGMDPFWGCGPPMWGLFDENACEMKELGPVGSMCWKNLYADPPVLGICPDFNYTWEKYDLSVLPLLIGLIRKKEE